jgi:hypothetical protein
MQAKLRQLSEYARSKSIRVYLAMTPDAHNLVDYKLGFVHDLMRQEALTDNYVFVDLLLALRGRQPQDLWDMPGDPHPNALGHRLMADALFPALQLKDAQSKRATIERCEGRALRCSRKLGRSYGTRGTSHCGALMIFSSLSLFAFFAIYFCFHLAIPLRFRNYLIIAGSTVFYSWWNVAYAWLPYLLMAIAFGGSKWMISAKTAERRRRRLFLSLVALFAPLVFFKYTNFLYREKHRRVLGSRR